MNASANLPSTGIQLSTNTLNFGSFPVGISGGTKAVTLSNSGSSAIAISSISVSGADPKDFTETSGCGSSLTSGAQCTVSVSFKAIATGNRTAVLDVADDPASTPQAVVLSATATGPAPIVDFSSSTLSLESEAVGAASAATTLTITNAGSASLSIWQVKVAGTDASDFSETNTCNVAIAPNAKCSVAVNFKPTVAGTVSATLQFLDNSASGSQSVALTGTVAGANSNVAGIEAVASISPLSLSFSSKAVGTASSSQSVRLENSGKSSMTISSIAIAGPDPKDFSQSNNCAKSLGVNSSCNISVTFKPTASGTRTASLQFTDGAGGSPQSVRLTGTISASSGTVSLSPSSLSFSNEPVTISSVAQDLTLSNSGASALTISGVSITGASAGNFVENNNCGSSLGAGSSCTIVVLFLPLAAGTETATLNVTDNGSASPQTVSLSGAGTHDVVLSWTASPTSGILGYEIYRGTSPGGEGSTPINSAPVAGSTYTDSSVTAGTTYYYTITSLLSSGSPQSSDSPEVSAAVP